MTVNQQIQQLEISIEQAKEMIAIQEALARLQANTDFKKVIMEGYFEKEAQRLVLLKSDPSMQSPEDQKALDNAIIGIGELRQYFIKINQMARMAEVALKEDRETLTELIENSEA